MGGALEGRSATPPLLEADADLDTLAKLIKWAMVNIKPENRRPREGEPIPEWTVNDMAAYIRSGLDFNGDPVSADPESEGGLTPRQRAAILVGLRKNADRARLEFPVRRRKKGLTQAEVVEDLDNPFSVRWFGVLESAAQAWPPEIAESYARLLQLEGAELARFREAVDYGSGRPSWYSISSTYLEELVSGSKDKPGDDVVRTLARFFVVRKAFFDPREREAVAEVTGGVREVLIMKKMRAAYPELVALGRSKLPPKVIELLVAWDEANGGGHVGAVGGENGEAEE